MGIENEIKQSSPQQILFFKNPEEIISVSCGATFSICICKNGVFSWGSNSFGQLGIGNNDDQSSLQQILFFKNPEEIISLSCGGHFSICICKNGVFSWGYNHYGQLGIGNQINQSSPQQISFFKNPEEIISLCCGNDFSICIYKNGVFGWGYNGYGQLGIETEINQFFPQQIEFFKNPEEIISLCCGAGFFICICKNGVFGWGKKINSKKDTIRPLQITFEKKIESFSNLSFPQCSTRTIRMEKKLLLILAREHLDPDTYIMGKYYLPWDMFKILFNKI